MMKTLSVTVLCALLLLVSGCSKEQGNADRQKKREKTVETINKPAPKAEMVAAHLNIPWSIEKTGDTFYISERTGTIMKVENGVGTRQQVNLSGRLSIQPESGLLGLVLAPDFSTSNRAFAYYSYDEKGATLNRVVSLQLRGNRWEEKQTLIDRIPSGNYHHGGRLKIGPDKKLYLTTGEGYVTQRAQDLRSLGGKILRMNLDGTIPFDNPFKGSYVYSYGHRNPQGLAWDEKGELYSAEHGQSTHDEINRITAGLNYGWPIIQGNEKKEGMSSPIFHTGNDTWAPSGIAIDEGSIYIAALRGEAVKRFDRKTGNVTNMVTGFGRIRDVRIEGNFLYFVTNNTDGRGTPRQDDDKLYKVPLNVSY